MVLQTSPHFDGYFEQKFAYLEEWHVVRGELRGAGPLVEADDTGCITRHTATMESDLPGIKWAAGGSFSEGGGSQTTKSCAPANIRHAPFRRENRLDANMQRYRPRTGPRRLESHPLLFLCTQVKLTNAQHSISGHILNKLWPNLRKLKSC